jgi:micrococcal nuclease
MLTPWQHALIIGLSVAWSLPARCQDASKAEFSGRVVSIADGDTLTVLRADRSQVKIRLHGVDTPETGQDFGTWAKEAAAAMAFGKDVTSRPVDRDRYGRTVAEIILPDGRSMNHELVRDGWAWWYREYAPKDRQLERLESEAKTAKEAATAGYRKAGDCR